MPRVTLSRWAAAGVAIVLLCVVVAWEQPAQAGGPILVGGPTLGSGSAAPGVPFTWSTAGLVSYHTDQGTLGTLNTAAADALVLGSFGAWQDVPTANIGFTRTGDLGLDVTGANQMNFFNNFINDCNPPQAPAPTNAVNAIVYDTDGSITDGILGVGESNSVIGFAGVVCISSNGVTNRLTRGRAVLNGKFQDDVPTFKAPQDLSPSQFQQVFTHEFGHLIGLDHSQVNNEVADQAPAARTDDDLFGLPVMFPLLLSGSPARADQPGFLLLAPDDEAWVSFLYPDSNFNATFGRINGRVFFSGGVTPVQGTNLIARLQDNGGTPENESRRFAVSSSSGYLFTGNPGQSVTGTNTGGSMFGSRDPAQIGFFEIPVKAGSYTLQVEAIDPEWVEGSSLGPLSGEAGEQFPLPGTAPPPTSAFPVNANQVITRNITLIGTQPRFDSFESARLDWREPAPAWLRGRRPPAFLVAG